MTTMSPEVYAYWKAEMDKAKATARTAKSKAAVKKANDRMMECRMAMRDAVTCSEE